MERHLWVLGAGLDTEVAVAAIRVQLLARQRGAASGGPCSFGVASGTQSEPSSANRPTKARATVTRGGGLGVGGWAVRTQLCVRRDPPQMGEAKQRENEHHRGADEGADRGDPGDYANGAEGVGVQ